jgi:hypothetical protein
LISLGWGLFIDLDQNFSFARCVAFEVIAALVIGPDFLSPLAALQRQLQEEDIATATATFGFVHNVAAAMSVALGCIVFQNGMENQLSAIQQTLDITLASKFLGSEAGANIDLIHSLPPNQKIVVQSAYAASLRNIWILYISIASLGLFSTSLISEKTICATADILSTGEEICCSVPCSMLEHQMATNTPRTCLHLPRFRGIES